MILAIKHALSGGTVSFRVDNVTVRWDALAIKHAWGSIVLALSARLSVLMHALVSPPFGRRTDGGIA